MRPTTVLRTSLLSILIVQQLVLPAGFAGTLARAEADTAASAQSLANSQVDDDYDVEKYAEIARRAAAEEQDRREIHSRAQSAARDARERRDASRDRVSSTRRLLVEARDNAQAARGEIPQLRDRLAQQEARIRELENLLPEAQQDLQKKRAEASRMNSRAVDLERRAEEARKAGASNAAELTRQARDARAAANSAREAAQQANARVESLAQSLEQTRSGLAQTRDRIEQRQTDLQRLTQQTIPTLERQEAEQTRALQGAEEVLALREREAEQAQRAYETARTRTEAAERRLAEIRGNLERAIAVARQQGNQDGSREGERDGSILGRNEGMRDGLENGNREGRRDGMAEGMERARREGARDGQAAGWNLGSSTGSRDGERDGRSEGQQNGRTDGMIAGYREGLSEGERTGYPQGLEQGHADQGYDQGLRAGRAQGEVLAIEDALKKGRPEGYAQAEAELRSGALAEMTLPGPSFLETSRGDLDFAPTVTFSDFGPSFRIRAAQAPGTRLSTSARRNYPHPAIGEAYQRAYADAYRDSRQNAYQREYREAYQPAYQTNYRREFAEWVSKPYPSEYREAYDRASAAAYAEGYRREYRESYDRHFRPAYDSAYSGAYPVRRKEGYDRGYAEGFERGRKEAFDADYSQGFTEGRRLGYEAAYPAALERAREEGRQAARQFYATHAVLEAQDLRLIDRNGDGTFAAGEPIDLRAVISNFGNVDALGASALSVEFAPLTEGIETSESSAIAPALAARTRTTLLSLGSGLSLRLKPTAQPGVVQRLRLRLLQQDRVLSERILEVRPAESLQIIGLTFAEPISDNAWNSGALAIRNAGSRPTTRTVRVRLTSSESSLEIESADFEIPTLAAGESRELQIRLRFPEALAFRRIGLKIQLDGGTWQSGRSVLEFDTTRRWSHNPSSEGLLIVTSREEGLALERAARNSNRAFDIWNTQAEGPLGPNTLRLYRQRLLVVADARTVVHPETRESILTAFENGTSVIDLAISRAGTGTGRAPSLAEGVEDRAERMPLAREEDELLIRESNPFAGNAPLRWMSQRRNGAETANVAQSIRIAALLCRPFDGQLGLAAEEGPETAENAAGLRAVSHSLIMEMAGINAVDGSQFGSRAIGREQLKISGYVGAVTAFPEGRGSRRLLSLFPELELNRKNLGGWFDRQRLQLKKILKPVARLYRNG